MNESQPRPEAFDIHDCVESDRQLLNEDLPRVLFVSVNPFSETSNNGKTFASFFEGYPEGRLAQLYFHREVPSSRVCSRYYHVTDEDILRSLWRPWSVTGAEVERGDQNVTSPLPSAPHNALKRSSLARLFRQVLWTGVRLENERLLSWLDNFDPQVIFFCGGDAAALYAKVERISQRYAAALVYYITDDYVLPVRSRNWAGAISRAWTRRVFLRMSRQADLVLTVGEKMSIRYEEVFGVKSSPIMNIVEVPGCGDKAIRRPGTVEKPVRLTYAGSFHSNRWRVLEQLRDSLERLSHQGVYAELHIYGPEPTKDVADAIHRPPLSRYGGLLDARQLGEALAETDILVHVEADDPESIAVTALSVSTKIPEYLASGKPVLAVGPNNVASIEYLSDNAAAAVVEPGDQRRLDAEILRLAKDPSFRAELGRRGHSLAMRNHDGRLVRARLWRDLKALVP